MLFLLSVVVGSSCGIQDNKGEIVSDKPYAVLLEEDENVVHAYAPKVMTDYEDQILVVTRDGKALVQYDKRTGAILKKSLISDLPQEEILSDLISKFSPEAGIEDVLSDPSVMEAMMFYAFIKSDNEVMLTLSMKIPIDSTLEYQGERVKAKVFTFGLAILTLDKSLKYKDHKALYTSGLKAEVVNPASSDWLMKDGYLAIPLQFGNETSPGYRYAVMREAKSGYKLMWLGSLPSLSGLKAHDGFNKFAWSFSNNFVSIGNRIYEMGNLTKTGLELKEKYVVDATGGIRSFIVKNDVAYYELGHPVDVFNSIETKFEVKYAQLDGTTENSESFVSREKRIEHSPCLFSEDGVYFANKPLNEPCELVFYPY